MDIWREREQGELALRSVDCPLGLGSDGEALVVEVVVVVVRVAAIALLAHDF